MKPSGPHDAHDMDRLDQPDALLARLRPIGHLFQMMGAVGDTGDGAALVRGCSEIGLNLTQHFRKELERVFGRDGGGGSGGQNDWGSSSDSVLVQIRGKPRFWSPLFEANPFRNGCLHESPRVGNILQVLVRFKEDRADKFGEFLSARSKFGMKTF